MNRSPLHFDPVERNSRFDRDVFRSRFKEERLRYSLMQDVPPGTGEQDWGLPFWGSSPTKLYSRMSGDFSIPVDGAPQPSIPLEPQLTPPTGRFAVTVGVETKYVDLEFVTFT